MVIWSTLQTNRWKTKDNAHHPIYTVLKNVKSSHTALEQRVYVGQLTVFEEHTSGTPLYTLWSWYTPGKFWYTLVCTIHPVDKHWSREPTIRTSGFTTITLHLLKALCLRSTGGNRFRAKRVWWQTCFGSFKILSENRCALELPFRSNSRLLRKVKRWLNRRAANVVCDLRSMRQGILVIIVPGTRWKTPLYTRSHPCFRVIQTYVNLEPRETDHCLRVNNRLLIAIRLTLATKFSKTYSHLIKYYYQ